MDPDASAVIEAPRHIEVGDAPADIPGVSHAVILWYSPNQSVEIYLTTEELNSLVNKCAQRLHETDDLTWH